MSDDPGRLASSVDRLIGPDRGWIGAQLALLTLGSVGGLAEVLVRGRGFSLVSDGFALAAGGVLAVAAGGVLLKAKQDLAANLTMSPTPVDDGYLVDCGIYGSIRHPMYLGVLL